MPLKNDNIGVYDVREKFTYNNSYPFIFRACLSAAGLPLSAFLKMIDGQMKERKIVRHYNSVCNL